MRNGFNIIVKHCGNVEERIKACRSREIAVRLKERLCDELSVHCASDMIKGSLLNFVDKLIERTFDADGHNKTLEDK